MSKLIVLLAFALVPLFQDPAPTPAPAQEEGGDGGGRRPRRTEFGGGQGGGFQFQDPERAAEMRVRMLKESLGLSDEQAQKVTEIFKQAREAEQKVETDRQAKVRETLSDDQKKKYDELIQNQNRAQGPLGGLDRMMSGFTDRLKRELSLDDATLEKVKAHVEEFRKKIAERGDKLRQGGEQLNWPEEMQKFQEGAKEVGEQIKAHLTPEQKEKFDKLVEQMQGGRGGFGGGERRGPPTAEERATRVMTELKIADAGEQSVIKAGVLKIFEAQNALGEYDRESRGKLDEIQKDGGLTDEQVNAKLNELKAARLERDKAWRATQAALREIVSPRQELELIRAGVLR